MYDSMFQIARVPADKHLPEWDAAELKELP
jgi:hypothetical protein